MGNGSGRVSQTTLTDTPARRGMQAPAARSGTLARGRAPFGSSAARSASVERGRYAHAAASGAPRTTSIRLESRSVAQNRYNSAAGAAALALCNKRRDPERQHVATQARGTALFWSGRPPVGVSFVEVLAQCCAAAVLHCCHRSHARGGCVLVSDHDSYWDGVVATALDPRIVPVVSRRWRAIRSVGWFLDAYGVLWTGDDTVERATAVVGEGGVVWIAPFAFPRGGVRLPAHTGAAHICMRGEVPLVPVALEGLGRSVRPRWRRGPALAAIGAPMSPASREDARGFTTRFESVLRSSDA